MCGELKRVLIYADRFFLVGFSFDDIILVNGPGDAFLQANSGFGIDIKVTGVQEIPTQVNRYGQILQSLCAGDVILTGSVSEI